MFPEPRLGPAHLVVEVDGGSHIGWAAAEGRRNRFLARLGCRVPRLAQALVLADVEEAVARRLRQIRSAAAFWGIKQPGHGRELSSFGIRELVTIKTMAVNQRR